MPPNDNPPEPWQSFFSDIDRALGEPVALHCCGGFVVTQLYGVARTTSDVDFLDAVPNVTGHLMELAGRGSSLHRKHHLYLDAVTVATPPEDYDQRMVQLYPGMWRHLRLCALEAHDVALSKLAKQRTRPLRRAATCKGRPSESGHPARPLLQRSSAELVRQRGAPRPHSQAVALDTGFSF